MRADVVDQLLPDLSQAVEEIQRADVVVICKVDDSVQAMEPDVLEGGVPLADVSVEVDAAVLAAYEVPAHDAGFPESRRFRRFRRWPSSSRRQSRVGAEARG
ncbi:hypothetical protein B296_00042486 [Ensete ventricosum]|uniref:Uncharacterized protein n=1 Tax=Ensete ventricosum TaxID=4639 RepID=A0A426XUQ0_ENSVE|nr:hypothetical protein B296_00042486 [Ensete ventricosum]